MSKLLNYTTNSKQNVTDTWFGDPNIIEHKKFDKYYLQCNYTNYELINDKNKWHRKLKYNIWYGLIHFCDQEKKNQCAYYISPIVIFYILQAYT